MWWELYHFSANLLLNQSNNETTTTTTFFGHYTGQLALAGTSSYELGYFVCAKFYCPHALAESQQISERIFKIC